jgi:hypothetical protein
MISFLKRKLYDNKSEAGKFKLRSAYMKYHSLFFKSNLDKLAVINGSDKYGLHFYTTHYDFHFRPMRSKAISLLEIGVGGHNNPLAGGGSLRMWKRYFNRGKIFSIDIYDKQQLQEPRIKIFQGSQVDKAFLEKVIQATGPLDIIIDDGSHVNEHVLVSFELLFKHVKEGGYYVIEDTQTSYWPDFGGTSRNFEDKNTIMGYFKSLADGLNYQEYVIEGYQPSFTDMNITAVHFYHNMIFIRNGINNEGRNVVKDGVIASEIVVED